jgi:2-iminobutanoate/2-iminopropanoate deaminase
MTDIDRIFEIYPDAANSAVPLAIRVNDMVMAGGLDGVDPATGEPADGLEAQTKLAFAKMAWVMEEAGGSLANVGRAVAYVTRLEDREPVNGLYWEEIFPDPADRPAYKVILGDLSPGVLVQIDVLGLLGGTRRRIDVPGIPARDPTVVIGNLVLSSRLHGLDHTGQLVEGGLEAEAAQTYATMRELVEIAGGTAADIVQIDGFGKTEAYAAPARVALEKAFADVSPVPAFNPLVNFITPRFEISADMIAVIGGKQ